MSSVEYSAVEKALNATSKASQISDLKPEPYSECDAFGEECDG